MIRQYLVPIAASFWASPHESMALIANWGTMRCERNAIAIKALDPVMQRHEIRESPSPRDPGKVPPPKKPETDPNPRSVQ